jgi:hypothetical protein
MVFIVKEGTIFNLARLYSGVYEIPTFMVGERKTNKIGRNKGILKPNWFIIETKI